MAWPVFPTLFVLAGAACAAFLVAFAYGVSAYLNVVENNTPAFWREMRRGLLAFAVLLACLGGIVATGVAADTPPASTERNTP